MIENIRLSFQGVWSHKMRSFLTMLGIIIGIASIISIISTIKGTNEQIKSNLVGAGDNSVDVRLTSSEGYSYSFSYESVPYGIPMISDDMLEEILAIEEVENAARFTERTYYDYAFYQNTQTMSDLYGIDQNYFDTCGYIVRTGRNFSQSDYDEFKRVVIIDKDIADSLFQDENPIGKTLEIATDVYTVIGVVEKAQQFEPVINSLEDYQTYNGYDGTAGSMFIPSSAWPITFKFDEPENLVVKAVDTDSMTSAGKKAADVLNTYYYGYDEVKYRAEDILEKTKNLQELSEATNNQLLWIASISLLVGGIGVMNIMLVSVTERTREIGLKKAIGARKSKIMIQFLTEAAVLTSLGGVLGIIAGIILAEVISRISETPVAISVPAIILSVGFSMLIGIIFGLLPSVKAANLNPIDALRHE